MNRSKSFMAYSLALLSLGLTSAPVHACTVCFGQSDSNLAQGMNMGILVLLLVITSVLCGVAGFFVFVARRTAQLEEGAQRLSQTLSQSQTKA